jgi:TPR repeat protein
MFSLTAERDSLVVHFPPVVRQTRKGTPSRFASALGEFYVHGEGVPLDLARAMDIYEKACNGGDASGCANAAVMYQRGMGVTPDETVAAQRIQRGCQLGLRSACVASRNPEGQ